MTTRADHTMLVCIRSFGFYDPVVGGQTMTAGRSYVVPDHYAARRFPENFARSDRPVGVTREGRPVGGVAIRSR
jgi:hypothetical protein